MTILITKKIFKYMQINWQAFANKNKCLETEAFVIISILLLLLLILLLSFKLVKDKFIIFINTKDTAFMFTFTPFPSIKMTASKNFKLNFIL